mgnify:CR=1 FL=1
MKHSIGKTIAALRKEKMWTQVELAEKLNVSDKTVSKWESEAGMPEISQLPVMAELFGVSIDYLMTGKEQEKEIVTMSKAELCAKTDDMSLAEEVKNLTKDENNKNVVDYILEYQSLNVFKKLCESDTNFIKRFKIVDAITLATLSNSLYLLCGKTFSINESYRFTFENEDEIKSLLPLEDKEYFRDYQAQSICLLPREFFTLLATDKRIGENTLNKLLSNQNGRECEIYAIIDTGNRLRDSLTGRPVHVITGEIAEKLGCTDFSSKRVITYQSIGKENGTMPILMLDCLCCQCEKEEKWVEKPLVAVSERQKLSNVYDMILNPDDL